MYKHTTYEPNPSCVKETWIKQEVCTKSLPSPPPNYLTHSTCIGCSHVVFSRNDIKISAGSFMGQSNCFPNFTRVGELVSIVSISFE